MKNIFVIGQAPARPGSNHGVPGAYLRRWLYHIGLGEDQILNHFQFHALMGAYPGSDAKGHLRPTLEQMAAHRPMLIEQMRAFAPDLLLLVGSMAIAAVLPQPPKSLTAIIGQARMVNPFECLPAPIVTVPLPHPSGRSTWTGAHPELVEQALDQLRHALDR